MLIEMYIFVTRLEEYVRGMAKFIEKHGKLSRSLQSFRMDEFDVKKDRSRLRKPNRKWNSHIKSEVNEKTDMLTKAILKLLIVSHGPSRQTVNYNQNKRFVPNTIQIACFSISK